MTFLPDPYVLENDSRTLNVTGVQRNFEAIDARDVLLTGVKGGAVDVPVAVGRNKYTITIPFAATVFIAQTSNTVASVVTVHGSGPTVALPATTWAVDIETDAAQTVPVRWLAIG